MLLELASSKLLERIFAILFIIIFNETNSYLNDYLVLAIDKAGSKVDYLSGNASFDMLCGRIGK